MDEVNFYKAQNLISKITEKQAMLDATKTQQTECILFSLNDPLARSVVCNDLAIIEEVRTMLIAAHETRLQFLKDEFEKL